MGGGNTVRSTTAVRANYISPNSVALYDLALLLYEGLSREMIYNIMLSQRGMLMYAHTPTQMEICTRVADAMQLSGVDGAGMAAEEASPRAPLLNQGPNARLRCHGGGWRGRGRVARRDAVAMGYGR